MPKTQDLQSQQEWVERMERWRRSGQSVSDWCKKNRIKRSAFYRWRKRLIRSHSRSQEDSIAHAFVEIPEEPSSDTGIEIECQNLIIRVKKEFDSKTLRSCLQILRGL